MNMSSHTVVGLISTLLLAGCISTTTGSITEPVRDDADASELNYQLGARYYQQGSYDLARDRLLLATEIDPKLAVAYSTLALTYEKLENLRLARKAYEDGVRAAPRDFHVQNAYAVFLCRQKEVVKAKRYFDKAIDHAENDNAFEVMTNAGQCMISNGEDAAAEQYYRDALQRKPGFGEALLQLCLMKYRDKDYLGSRAFLARHMSSNIPTAGVLYLASKIEEKLDNDRGKTEFEDELIRQFPASEEARKILGAK